MKYRFGRLLLFHRDIAREYAKAYIWQALSVKIRDDFPEINSVLITKNSVEIRFENHNGVVLKDEIFFEKLKEAGVKESSALSKYRTYIFDFDKTIKLVSGGISYS